MTNDDATPTAMPRAEPDDGPAPGSIVAGRFEVLRPLGAGGEAAVHVAHDRELGLDVVLKTRRFTDTDDLERLRREAGLLMRIAAHPGLPVVRSDAVEGDRYFMISDRVDGRDLRELIEAVPEARLPLTTVLGVIDELGATLDHLHGHRPPVIHGDVKPENVLVDAAGRAILVDFGAAMRVGDDRERMGTPGFSAPEVLAGEPVRAASDVFSLAALTVFLLTGLTPTPGTPWPAAMSDHRLARLERVIRRGLTWDPLGRPWSASDFAASLRAAAEDDIPAGTVTLVLAMPVDAAPVGSTSRRDADVAAVLDAAGGRQVTSAQVPDGAAIWAFSRAADAATGALEAAAVASDSWRLAVHAGDVGGRHGATIQQLADEVVGVSARLPGVAVAGSHPVRTLLANATGVRFVATDADAFELRAVDHAGLPTDAGDAEAAVRSAALDPAAVEHAQRWIASRRSSVLAGRDRELADATVAVDRQRAAAAAASLVVRGDAGMGKTRFLAELAARADAAGELVVVGRCTESGGAFEVFLDALGDELFPFEQGRLERDEEGWVDRRRFFGRISDALATQARPITMVLDDLQWIDGSSLALLAQLLDDVGPSLAVLAGCRPGVPAEVLDQLLVRPGATELTMGPIEVDDFAAMANDAAVDLSADRRRSLHALTAGSPFFAVQLLDHLRLAPDVDLDEEVPSGVLDWLRQRMERTGEGAMDVMAAAATVGRSFDVIVLGDVLGASPLQVAEHLDRAVGAGLLIDGERPGEFRFVHTIAQTAMAETLSTTRRGLLHAAIARRLEEQGDEPEHLEAALHHWLAADRLGDPVHTGELAARVGTITTERLAHEQAVNVLQRSLDVVTSAPGSRDRDRAEAQVRVALGRALFVATRSDEAISELFRAADLAEAGDDAETLAQAALVASLSRRHGRDDPELLDLLRRASERCPDEPAVLPAMLHIRRSRLLPLTMPHEERADMARRGLDHVERMDPVDRAMVETEVARACWYPGDAEQRVETTTQIIDIARRETDRGGPSRWTGVLIEALNLRWAALVQLGRLHDALADATDAVRRADDAGTTFLLSRSLMGKAMIRAAIGEHDEAERLCAEALGISDRHNLVLVSMAITYCIERDQGRQLELAQLEDQLSHLIESNSMFVAPFALVHAEAGNHDDARRLLDDLDRREPWPFNWVWLATAVAGLEAAVIVGDRERSARYAAALTPFSGHWAIAAAELGCWGPVDRVLGIAAGLAGDATTARRLLLDARDSASANGATFWAARCHAGLAELGDAQNRST